MPRKESCRKCQLTINNPLDHGFTHDRIKSILSEFSVKYWCMCDEVGERGTPHTHIFVVFVNSVMFDTLHKQFYGAHIERAKGTNQENQDYVRKCGKWLDDAKHETSKPETFEECGELPPDRSSRETQAEQIMQMVKDGMTNAEIIEAIPGAYNKIAHIEAARQAILQERHKSEWRDLDVTYIWGSTGTGKTRSVMEKYGYANVYRVTDYSHPFDGYMGQEIILFEEFRSSLPLSSMLTYLEGYPINLPCRYANKVACFTKVFLISNIPLEKQYPNVQIEEKADWDAFCRRIGTVIHFDKDFPLLPADPCFNATQIFGDTEGC